MDSDLYRLNAVVKAIHEALNQHPAGVADVKVDGGPEDWLWQVRVLPRSPGAASFTVSLVQPTADEVILQFGSTHCYVFEENPAALASWVKRYCGAVAAGRFVDAGSNDDSFARVWDDDGTEWVCGSLHLPLPWRWRRTRSYAPYS